MKKFLFSCGLALTLIDSVSNIKVKYNEKFEKSLSDEQLKTLEHMRELKKQGKSCCPCGKNRYY